MKHPARFTVSAYNANCARDGLEPTGMVGGLSDRTQVVVTFDMKREQLVNFLSWLETAAEEQAAQ